MAIKTQHTQHISLTPLDWHTLDKLAGEQRRRNKSAVIAECMAAARSQRDEAWNADVRRRAEAEAEEEK